MEGVNNVQEILDEANGIMVARGDLGVEVPFEELPAIQKSIITCHFRGKRVVTATQMLESMAKNPRPTVQRFPTLQTLFTTAPPLSCCQSDLCRQVSGRDRSHHEPHRRECREDHPL